MLNLSGVSYRYPGQENWACRDISLQIEPGTVLGLLGENGAGKSTLASVIRGQLKAQQGQISGNCSKVGLVHQNPLAAPGLKVWQEVFCGKGHHSGALFSPEKLKKQLQEMQDKWKIHLDLDQDHGNLNRRELQQAEWLGILLENPELVILDEPDFDNETSLGHLLDRLKARNKSVILITHHLKDAMTHCDQLYLMSQGELSLYENPKRNTFNDSSVKTIPKKEAQKKSHHENPLIDLTELCADGLSYQLYPGDHLVVLGYRESGLEALEEKLLTMLGTQDYGYIPSEGQRKALDSGMSLAENIHLHHRSFRGGKHRIKDWYRDAIEKLKRGPWDFAPQDELEKLSGGNRQRLLIYREMDRWNGILLASEPCKNLDSRRRREIHRALMDHQDKPSTRGLIYLTNEPRELQESPGLATHLGLLYRGKIQSILKAPYPTEADLYRLMMGDQP